MRWTREVLSARYVENVCERMGVRGGSGDEEDGERIDERLKGKYEVWKFGLGV